MNRVERILQIILEKRGKYKRRKAAKEKRETEAAQKDWENAPAPGPRTPRISKIIRGHEKRARGEQHKDRDKPF